MPGPNDYLYVYCFYVWALIQPHISPSMHLFSVCSNTFSSLPYLNEIPSQSLWPAVVETGSPQACWAAVILGFPFALFLVILSLLSGAISCISRHLLLYFLLWWRTLFTSFLRKVQRRRIGVHTLSVCPLSPLFTGQYVLGHIHLGGLWLKSALRVSHGSLLAGFDLTSTPGWLSLPLAPESPVDPCSPSSPWPKMSKPHASVVCSLSSGLTMLHGWPAHGSQSIIGEELEVQTRPCPPAGSRVSAHLFILGTSLYL